MAKVSSLLIFCVEVGQEVNVAGQPFLGDKGV